MRKNRLSKQESANEGNLRRRDNYPDEQRYEWLTILLDSFAICDTETKNNLIRQARGKGVRIACNIGCHACCINPSVPISELEIRGLTWYVSEVMDYGTQDRLIPRFHNFKQNTECPFLLDEKCSVYPLRPIACRIFYVFNVRCGTNEDPTISRREDVYIQRSEIPRRVAMRFLDADTYGLKTIREKEVAFERGIMFEKTIRMHKIDWNRFISTILDYRRLKDK